MSDLIDRQKAYEVLTEYYHHTTETQHDALREALSNVPSAELERKKGYWVPVTNGRGGFECDQCHNYAPSYQNGDEYLSYYCPYCGTEMRSDNE